MSREPREGPTDAGLDRPASSGPADRLHAEPAPDERHLDEPPPDDPAASSGKLEEKLAQLPKGPGVYLLHGARGKVIYVGKASSLKSRVRSYFQNPDDGRTLYPFLVREVRDLSWCVTGSDQEALILENNLIKQHRPRFNVKLVDDKTYLSIKVTKEPFPRALLVRRAKPDGAQYFGPYASAKAIRDTLRTLRRHFALRTCTNAEYRQRTRPCIQHQIGRCGAPCVGLQTEADYQAGVFEAVLFLRGRTQELTSRLQAQMLEAAEALKFEAAARLRDQIRSIERTAERQLASAHDDADRDVFGEHVDGERVRIQGLFFREGRLVATHTYDVRARLGVEEAMRSFLAQLYAEERPLPDEVLAPLGFEDAETLAAVLSARRHKRVRVLAPQRGRKRELVEMARHNAREAFLRASERAADLGRALAALQEGLGLARLPRRIEAIDISQLRGQEAVGSVVALLDGEPDKGRYRKLKIRSPEARGDTDMMAEVLARRVRRRAKDPLPDLLVLDGGRAQLAEGERALAREGLEGEVDVVAIAKTHDERGRARRAAGAPAPERVFVVGREEPIVLAEGSAAMHMLQRLRDEAHRFAIGFHRALRRKSALRSLLDGIPGIGPRRKRALLEHFGTLGAIERASLQELAACPLVTPRQAEAIHAHLASGVDHAEALAGDDDLG